MDISDNILIETIKQLGMYKYHQTMPIRITSIYFRFIPISGTRIHQIHETTSTRHHQRRNTIH